MEIRIPKQELERLMVAYLRQYGLTEEFGERNWRITRMGSRGVTLSIVDESWVHRRSQRRENRDRKKYL